MKPNQEEREKLVALIQKRRANFPFSNAELAAIARVDPSQTSRILDGQFRTFSGNVLRICSVLGVDPGRPDGENSSLEDVRNRAAWARLEASVRRAWDQTPQGADRLAAVIDAVAEVLPTKRPPRDGTDVSPRGSPER